MSNAQLACLVVAAILAALGFFNFTWVTGVAPNTKTHSYNWLCGALCFVILGLWLVPAFVK